MIIVLIILVIVCIATCYVIYTHVDQHDTIIKQHGILIDELIKDQRELHHPKIEAKKPKTTKLVNPKTKKL